jgi:hypothetical protein
MFSLFGLSSAESGAVPNPARSSCEFLTLYSNKSRIMLLGNLRFIALSVKPCKIPKHADVQEVSIG